MHICRECGKEEEWTHIQKLIDLKRCFRCDFWLEKVDRVNDPVSTRVNGKHYFVGKTPKPGTPRSFLGFGGAFWKIKYHDGRVIETNNLWHQGKIPERFRERLPDNAIFLEP